MNASSKTSRQPSLALHGVPVLIVDDDLPSAKLLSVVLEAEGCRVQVAHSAEEAMPLVRTFKPRAITMDLILPLMSGLLFTQRLKEDPLTRGIVVVAITAFNGPTAERVALDAGCAAYVRKPIDPPSVIKIFSKSLGKAT
jgi:CheY-like chemotaxis protein